jgi:cytochrome c5
MIDSPVMGALYGPNITAGGVTKGWGPADWDRIVRHGIMHDGHTSVMPAIDYARLSDRELSDVIAYARSVPSSDKVMPPPRFGPLLNLLVATGQITTAASVIDHAAVPPQQPPPAEPNVAFGAHIAESCKGCHGRTFSGGPIEGGDPAWPAASNLTPTGLADASFEDFDAALRHGKTRRGERMPPPMPWQAYAGMTDVEVQALWAFFRSLPPMETGAR